MGKINSFSTTNIFWVSCGGIVHIIDSKLPLEMSLTNCIENVLSVLTKSNPNLYKNHITMEDSEGKCWLLVFSENSIYWEPILGIYNELNVLNCINKTLLKNFLKYFNSLSDENKSPYFLAKDKDQIKEVFLTDDDFFDYCPIKFYRSSVDYNELLISIQKINPSLD